MTWIVVHIFAPIMASLSLILGGSAIVVAPKPPSPVVVSVTTTKVSDSPTSHQEVIIVKEVAATSTADTSLPVVNPNASFMEVHGGAAGTAVVEPTKPYMETCEGGYTLNGYGCVPPYNY